MKKLFYLFALIVFTFASCEKNELDNELKTEEILPNNDENREARPVILGKQLNNPYSIENMKAALDTLKAHPDQHSSCMKAPSQTLDEIIIEPTDLYVRFLPADSIQFEQLMRDTTLMLYDYPLDYELKQIGDYYKDPTVSGKYTWLYTSVPYGYQPPVGIRYEVIQELFIIEHSPYYSVENAPANIKGINHVKSNVAKSDDYPDALKTIEAISFIITGNANQLNKPTTVNSLTGKQRAKSYVTKRFLWTTWQEAVYNPEGYIKVSTPEGVKPLAYIRVRVRRWVIICETRTNAIGKFYFNDQFGQDDILNNVEYKVYFDGKNGVNQWLICDNGLVVDNLGYQSPDTYSMTFTPSSDYWGVCVQYYAINNYLDISKIDGVILPPANLSIYTKKSSDYTSTFPVFDNTIDYGFLSSLTSGSDIVLKYQNILSDFYNITALTWHQFTHASQVNRMILENGIDWASDYWIANKKQIDTDIKNDMTDCFCITHKQDGECSQQIALTDGWANYREDVLMKRYYSKSGFIETKNPYLKQYVSMFSELSAIGCSNYYLEKSLCSNTILEFRNKLISAFPYLSQQITQIITDPNQTTPGIITLMTFNLWTKQNYAKNARVISCTDADRVAVQELREGILTNNFNDLKTESGLMGYKCVTIGITNYGFGLLWKPSLGTPIITEKITNKRSKSADVDDKRGFVIAEFENFYFIATHFSLDQTDRIIMSNEIINFASSVSKPVYVGGDFNEQPDDGAIANFVDNDFEIINDNITKTYPRDNPQKQYDLILRFSKKSTQHTIVSMGIPLYPNEYLKEISDHYPYYVTLDLNN